MPERLARIVLQSGGDSGLWAPIADGVPGETGPAGPTGPASTIPGPQGPSGAQGAQGPAGNDGATGAAGPKGDAGDQGIQGAAGAAGAQGAQGAQGATGGQGATGTTGTTGTTGATGATGAQGSPGNNAPTYQLLSNGATAMAFGTAATSKVTPTATATFTTTVPAAGTVCHLIILTSGTTSRTITFGTGFKPTATLATGTTTAKVFVIHWISDGTNLYESGRTAAMTA